MRACSCVALDTRTTREGRVETITQNGEAALIVMSPEGYDFLVQYDPPWVREREPGERQTVAV